MLWQHASVYPVKTSRSIRSPIASLLNLIYFLKYAYIDTYIYTYIFFYNILLENISRDPSDPSEVPCFSTIPELHNMISIPHTARLVPQTCAYVLVCFSGQHIEESNATEILWSEMMTHPIRTGWKGYHRFVWLLHCPSQEDRGHNQSRSTNLWREKEIEVYTSNCH